MNRRATVRAATGIAQKFVKNASPSHLPNMPVQYSGSTTASCDRSTVAWQTLLLYGYNKVAPAGWYFYALGTVPSTQGGMFEYSMQLKTPFIAVFKENGYKPGTVVLSVLHCGWKKTIHIFFAVSVPFPSLSYEANRILRCQSVICTQS